jgi:hypothetical protein
MRREFPLYFHIEAPVKDKGPPGCDVILPRESESFYLLLNFENDDSGLVAKMLCRRWTDSASFHFSHFYRHRHHSVS